MARFLLAPHAPTTGLAHVGACLEVAKHLRDRGHELGAAYGGSRPEVIEAEGIPIRRVSEVSAEREWHPSGWYPSLDALLDHVRSHVDAIEGERPDAVITSSGVAAALACEVTETPQLHLMHYLQTTPWGRRATVWGDRARDARHPRRALRVLRARARRRRSAPEGPTTRELTVAARGALGLPAAGPTSYRGVNDTAVAITSAPFIDPSAGLPPHWSYVGPLAWSAPANGSAVPVPRGERPLVYVTQGSTGDPGLLRRAVAELAEEEVDVLAATGGLCDPDELTALGPRVRAAELLPSRNCLEAADVAVVHGGHLTFCEALSRGTPMVVLPYRIDQIARVNRAERLGVGRSVWPVPRREGTVRNAVRRVLGAPAYGRRSSELANRLERWDGAANAAGLAERLASAG
jgi:UDP:flavonoid glycosyltransferase YjiC (YdhE family)